MRLSEAIRAGAKIRPQGRGRYYSLRKRWFGLRAEKTSCALGAAMEAADLPSEKSENATDHAGRDGNLHKGGVSEYYVVAPDEWNAVLYTTADCPQCERRDRGVKLIPHLNDDHKWTREEIALWVERREKIVLEPQAVPIPLPVTTAEEWPSEIGAD